MQVREHPHVRLPLLVAGVAGPLVAHQKLQISSNLERERRTNGTHDLETVNGLSRRALNVVSRVSLRDRSRPLGVSRRDNRSRSAGNSTHRRFGAPLALLLTVAPPVTHLPLVSA